MKEYAVRIKKKYFQLWLGMVRNHLDKRYQFFLFIWSWSWACCSHQCNGNCLCPMTSLLHEHCFMSCLVLQFLRWFKKGSFIGLSPKLSDGEKWDLDRQERLMGSGSSNYITYTLKKSWGNMLFCTYGNPIDHYIRHKCFLMEQVWVVYACLFVLLQNKLNFWLFIFEIICI